MTGEPPIRTVHLTNAWHDASGGIRTFYTAQLEHAERTGRHMTLIVPGDRDDVLERGRHTRIVMVASPRSPVVDRRYRMVMPHRYLFSRSTIWWKADSS